MANVIDGTQLTDWTAYRNYMKIELKKLGPGEPVYITKKKLKFKDEKGKEFPGYALLPGIKAKQSYMKCKQGGIQFHEGTCTLEGKKLHLNGFPEDKFVKEALKLFMKLKLGWKIAPPGGEGAGGAEGEEGAEAAGAATDSSTDSAAGAAEQAALSQLRSSLSDRIKTVVGGAGSQATGIRDLMTQAKTMETSGDFAGAVQAFERIRPMLDADKQDLVQKAQKIGKAVQIWNKTEEVATSNLRKLQKEILKLNDPRSAPVIKGLESILQKLDRVDDEAKEAAVAAQAGDPKAFKVARDDFVKKVDNILDYVSKDELIKDCDQNPAVKVDIEAILTKSLTALKQAV